METERLRFEPLDIEHAEGLFVALDDTRVGEFIGGPDVTTVEALVDRIEFLRVGPPGDRAGERWINLVARRADDGVIIGRLEATTYAALVAGGVDQRWGEIAYVFGPNHWNQGYAREAVSWLVEHLHGTGIDELWATVDPNNRASRRLLDVVGFTETSSWERPLGSYDDGDVVVVRRADTSSSGA